jgi:hypothetical protein
MTQPTLAQLVAPITQADALSLELATATGLGLTVTSWEPLDPSRTIFQVQANIISLYAGNVNFLAQGGYASYAAEMVDGNGNPITTWMDLLTPNNYNTIRFAAGVASGPVPYTNSNAASYPYSPNNPLHFQYPTSGGATYTSVGTGTIGGSSSGTVAVQADAAFVGAAGNAATGVILQLVTPLPGVTINALTQPFVGTPQETNPQLLQRSLNKLGTLSALTLVQQGTTPPPANPSAPSTAYDYCAQSIPAGTQSATWPYYVTTRITRSQTVGNPATGVVQQYLATAAGVPLSGDVAVIQAAVSALVVGQCITYVAQAASALTVNVSYTLYFRRSAGYTTTQIQSAILSALTNYFSAFPIGGLNTTSAGILPIAEVEATIYNALPGSVDIAITINGSSGNLTVGQGNVAVLGVVNGTVVFT